MTHIILWPPCEKQQFLGITARNVVTPTSTDAQNRNVIFMSDIPGRVR